MLKNANNADTGHYTVGGSDQRAQPTWTLAPPMPTKRVNVGLAAVNACASVRIVGSL